MIKKIKDRALESVTATITKIILATRKHRNAPDPKCVLAYAGSGCASAEARGALAGWGDSAACCWIYGKGGGGACAGGVQGRRRRAKPGAVREVVRVAGYE